MNGRDSYGEVSHHAASFGEVKPPISPQVGTSGATIVQYGSTAGTLRL